MKRTLRIPCFPGFYQSLLGNILESHEERCRDKYINEYGVSPQLLDKLDVSTEWVHESMQRIADLYAASYLDLVFQATGFNFQAVSVNISSPREYNFRTDELDVEIEYEVCDEGEVISFLRKQMRNNASHLGQIIKTAHSSRSGFWSFMSNDIEDWYGNIEDDNELYFDYAIFYLTHLYHLDRERNSGFGSLSCLDDTITAIVNDDLELDDPIFESRRSDVQAEWEAIVEAINEEHRRRTIASLSPQIPNLT